MASSSSPSPSLTRPCFINMYPCPLSREREQVRVAEALADLQSGSGRGGRCREVTGGLVLVHDRQHHPATLRTITSVALEHPLRTSEPAGRAAHLAPERQIRADPPCTARGASSLAGVDVDVMGTLQEAHPLVIAPEHVGRRRQELDVFGAERLRLIRTGQGLVGVPPCARGIGSASALELPRAPRRPCSFRISPGWGILHPSDGGVCGSRPSRATRHPPEPPSPARPSTG